MKTPDEIKKSLKCMMNAFNESCDFNCGGCPVYVPGHSNSSLAVDALAYIQQLEAANAELLTKVEQLESKCRQLERERDAAVEDMTNIVMKYGESYCEYCKGKDTHNCAGRCWIFNEGFEWRGVKEE